GAGDKGDVQLVDQARQGGAGGEFGMQIAFLLQLYAAFAQLSDDRAVVLIFEEAMDFVGHFKADFRQVDQHIRQRPTNALQGAQRTGQQLGGFFADVGNAQRIDKACQRRFAACIDGVEQVAGGNFGETFQLDDLLMGQAVKIRRGIDQTPVHQLFDDLVAQAIDIHGAARYEVDDRLLELRLAGQTADAAIDRALADRLAPLAALDQLGALHRRATYRALFGYLHGTGVGWAAF